MTPDATSYPLTGQVYLGKMPNAARQVNQGKRPWYRSGHNVVADNFFCSIPLAEELLEKNLTLVGTLRKTSLIYHWRCYSTMYGMDRAEYSSIFGFDGRITIVSYVRKKITQFWLCLLHIMTCRLREKNNNLSSLPTTTKQRVTWIIWTT